MLAEFRDPNLPSTSVVARREPMTAVAAFATGRFACFVRLIWGMLALFWKVTVNVGLKESTTDTIVMLRNFLETVTNGSFLAPDATMDNQDAQSEFNEACRVP